MKIYLWDEGNSGYDPDLIHHNVAVKENRTVYKKFSYFEQVVRGRKFVPNRIDEFLDHSGLKSYDEWRR